MTSNLGSDILTNATGGDDARKIKAQIMDIVKASFRPEFINRIDEIIFFHKLDKSNIKEIAKIMISNIEKRLSEHNITLNVTDQAFVWIVNNGYDPVYGARPLRRLLKNQIENKLALKLLSGEIEDNDTADIVVGSDGQLDVVKNKRKK